MSDRVISVTEAAKRFSDLVNRAYYRGEEVTLMRNNVAVAHLGPVSSRVFTGQDLAALWATLPRLSPEDAEALERAVAEARAELPSPRDPWVG
jgi:antitoxin (DNA-binding transcriptional repressor) of toxin-antitoxin stability system